MAVEESLNVAVRESSGIGQARRVGAELARQLGFPEVDAGRVALVATELAGNASRHARDAEVIWRTLDRADTTGIELLVLDRGPGIDDVAASLRDGFSTAGTPGTGFGAAIRVADRFDLHSLPGVGTAVVAEFWPGGGPRHNGHTEFAPAPAGHPGGDSMEFGAVSVAKPGETAIGDSWAVVSSPGVARVLVVDGLGHGPDAARAAREAVRAFRSGRAAGPAEMLGTLDTALADTRGAAAAIAEVDVRNGLVRYAGVGNISGTLVDSGETRSMVSMNGILGHHVARMAEFSYPWGSRTLLVMHSDGCRSRWQLDAYPGLVLRHPSLIAGVLYRDWGRGTDDVTVVAGRVAPGGGGNT